MKWTYHETSSEHSGEELYLEFAPMDSDSDEISHDIDTADLHRISITFMWDRVVWPGDTIFEKYQNVEKILFFRVCMSIFPGAGSPNIFFPSVHRQPLAVGSWRRGAPRKFRESGGDAAPPPF